jgi:hypothetical protein
MAAARHRDSAIRAHCLRERRCDVIGGGDELDVVWARGESLIEAFVDHRVIPRVVGTDLWRFDTHGES